MSNKRISFILYDYELLENHFFYARNKIALKRLVNNREKKFNEIIKVCGKDGFKLAELDEFHKLPEYDETEKMKNSILHFRKEFATLMVFERVN